MQAPHHQRNPVVRSISFACNQLSFNVHAQAGFQFNRVPVWPDGDFLHPAFDQNFLKLRQVGGLAADEILKLRDAADLLIPRDGMPDVFSRLVRMFSSLS